MATTIQVIQNNSITFDIKPYLTDRGWSILSPSVMEHSSDNSGELAVNSYNIKAGKTYEYSLVVTDYVDGDLVVSIGGVSDIPITSNGYHQGEITAVDNSPLTLWSDGNLKISSLNISELISTEDFDGKTDTITWSEMRKKWVTFKDFIPESGFSMFTNMFTLKGGNLWMHKTEGTTPNNFYGNQYSSKVKFPVIKEVGIKTYQSIAVHANKIIGTTQNGITTQLGNVADLITYDFETRQGIHYANKLRDVILNDKLQGRYIVIELTDEESKGTALQIFKIIVKSDRSTPSE